MNMRRALIAGVCATFLALPLIGSAQKGEKKDKAPDSITIDFGVLPPTTPILPNVGCATAGIGGPADPCSYRLHHLTPEEALLAKGGEATIKVNGGGHAPAIYKVSKDTTRFDLGQFLCEGPDPEHIDNPAHEPCNLVLGTGAANAAAAHLIKDGDGNVVITAAPARKRSILIFGVRPRPPAAFSPLTTMKSRARSSLSRGSESMTARRPGSPMMSPRKRSLSTHCN